MEISKETALRNYVSGKFSKAFDMFYQLAKGDVESMRYIGFMYWKGIGVEKNTNSAITWLESAANLNDKKAQFYLAKIYSSRGRYHDSFKWYEKSALNEFPPALYRLSLAYSLGLGVEKNEKMFIKLLKEAVSAGHIHAIKEYSLYLYKESRNIFKKLYAVKLFLSCYTRGFMLVIKERNNPLTSHFQTDELLEIVDNERLLK